MEELFDEYSGMIIAAQSLFIAVAVAFSIFLGPDSAASSLVDSFCSTLGLW